MNTSNPKSSSVRQAESPEYMDVDGFEGFFYETKERRIVEFEEFVSDADNIDGVDAVLGDNTADEKLDSDYEDELLLLNEILNFEGEVGILTRVCQGKRVETFTEFPYLVFFLVHVIIDLCPIHDHLFA